MTGIKATQTCCGRFVSVLKFIKMHSHDIEAAAISSDPYLLPAGCMFPENFLQSNFCPKKHKFFPINLGFTDQVAVIVESIIQSQRK